MSEDLISRQAAIDAMWELRRDQQMLDDTQTADKVMRGIFLSEQKIKELPSADIDLSDYSDRLWRNAYERGKADAESEIIHCRECKYAHLTYDGDCKQCDKWLDDDDFHLTLYLDGDFYCGYAEGRTDE